MRINEIQRLQYLEALGIDSYMPRKRLPCAPVARLCTPVVRPNKSAPASSAAPVAVERVIAELEVGKGSVVQSSAGAVVADHLKEGAAVTEPLPAGHAAQVAGQPRFSLGLWTIEDQLLVIDSRQPQAALPTESLLRNLLFALGYTATLPRVEVFNWPLHENIPDAQGDDSARDALAAMLEARVEGTPVKRCLLLGATACYYCIPPDLVAESGGSAADPAAAFAAMLGKSAAIVGARVTAVVTSSLTEMLRDPQLKRPAWLAMRPLRKNI